MIVLIPRIVRLPALTQADLRPVGVGTESIVHVRPLGDILAPVSVPATYADRPVPATRQLDGATVSPNGDLPARIRLAPENINLKVGEEASIDVNAENVNDLFSVPLLLQYDPRLISIEEVHHGGFLSGGTQAVALVERVDKEHGQAIISAARQPNTAGVSGNGTLLSLVVRAIGKGSSKVSIVQVNAKDSRQKHIPVVTGDLSIVTGE